MFASRKRLRDEDEDDMLELEHASKVMVSTTLLVSNNFHTRSCSRAMQKQEKQCSLPFRTSPNTKHVRAISRAPRTKPAPLLTQTVTPADSSEEENSPRPFSSSLVPRPQPSSQLATGTSLQVVEHTFDSDMDMSDSQPIASPLAWPQQLPLQTPNASPCTVTPPQPAFREPFEDSTQSGRLPTPIYGHFRQSIDAKMDIGEDSESTISRSQQEINYGMYAQRRRLPTPIDEDEAMDIPHSPPMFRRFALGNDSFYQNQSPIKMSPGFAASPKGSRLSFSMGVRADCELCRDRVPGHSNHIFRS